MKTQLSFVYEGRRYLTIFGADELLNTAEHVYNNVVNAMSVQSKLSLSKRFKELFGVDPRVVPLISNPTVEVFNNNIIVNGTVTIDGMEYRALIAADHLEIDGKDPNVETAPEPEPEPEPEPVVEEQAPTQEVKPEPVVEEPSPAPVVEEPSSAPIAEEQSPEPVVEEPVTESEEVQETTPVAAEEPAAASNDVESLLKIPRNVGFTIRNTTKQNAIDLSTKSKDRTPGFVLNGSMPKPVTTCKPFIPAPTVPDPIQTVDDITENKPVEQTPEMPIKSLKERLRDELTPEVNAVIGDIPLQLLGDIPEFTMNPIVESEVSGIYCMENHWRKCGNWYAIDSTTESLRYFYNRRRGGIYKIPTKTCAQWLRAVQ